MREIDTGKRQMQTRDQAWYHDIQSGNGMGWDGIGTHFPENQEIFFQSQVQEEDTARLQHPPPSDPSCWELGTSRGALNSGHSVGRKRNRLCLLEHIFLQLKQHEIKLVQWIISPQKQQIPCLWWATMVALFSVWPSSCPWVCKDTSKFSNSAFPVWKKDNSDVIHSKIPSVTWTLVSDLLFWNSANTSLQLLGAEKHCFSHLSVQLRGNSSCIWHFVSQERKMSL